MADKTTGVYVWLVASKAAHALELHARKNIETLDLCLSDFMVLEVLLHKGALPVGAIGAKVLLTSGSITTAIDRLEAKGLVERGADPADRRSRIVRLTNAGRRLITEAFRNHARAMEQAAAGLSHGERGTLIRLLKKLGQGAGGLDADQ